MSGRSARAVQPAAMPCHACMHLRWQWAGRRCPRARRRGSCRCGLRRQRRLQQAPPPAQQGRRKWVVEGHTHHPRVQDPARERHREPRRAPVRARRLVLRRIPLQGTRMVEQVKLRAASSFVAETCSSQDGPSPACPSTTAANASRAALQTVAMRAAGGPALDVYKDTLHHGALAVR